MERTYHCPTQHDFTRSGSAEVFQQISVFRDCPESVFRQSRTTYQILLLGLGLRWRCNPTKTPQDTQNQAPRIVTNSPFDKASLPRSLPLISQLGWLNRKEMIDFETANMVYKSLHGLSPAYMRDMFHKLSDCRNRVLRSTETDLEITRFKTSKGQRSFSYRGVTVWNQLSPEIKTAPSLAIFKNRLKKDLFENHRSIP